MNNEIEKPLAGRRILIAEDDRQMSAILSMILSKSGCEIRAVYDGAEALREIKGWQPHLVVLDVMLPVIDGFHICQTINEKPVAGYRPKILIVSGRGSDWDQNLGIACGAEDYLVKPFNNVDFLRRVLEILGENAGN
jgi:DNA-binding response OmpR family regulator